MKPLTTPVSEVPLPASPPVQSVHQSESMNKAPTPYSRILVLLAAALFSLGAISPAAAAGLSWDSLTPQQQQVLKPMQDDWAQLPPERQEKMAARAARWESMTPEQRQKAEARMQRWQELTPEQKQKMRERREKFSKMNPEQRERMRERHERVKSLPPEQRQALRDCVKRKRAGETVDCKSLLPPPAKPSD